MKKKVISTILCAMLFALAVLSFSGCAATADDPKDAIRDQYGNKEFTVSFNTGGLDEPIEDIGYTANKMPVLPSPSRVGYVFAGWYMDSAYSVPYVDGILYLYMKDVTLYAKWSKEELVASGVYDLEISASVMQETVFKGLLTDQAGGYKDFADCIIYDEVCIENSDGHKYMKIPYDTGIVENMTEMEALPALKVSDSSKNATAFIDTTKTIANYADTRKTIFVNIDEWNIESPLYLDIKTTNYDNKNLSSTERAQTITTYTAEIRVTRFIGFSKPYADYTQPLEDGWYLAKSYYRSENNAPNMGSGFNPVYSYLHAANGKYTLVKQFTPYLGMLGSSNTLLSPVTANYYNRLASFAPIQLYYNMEAVDFDDEVQSDYYPKTYNGTNYGEFVAEFHADTGKYYAIYDFGDDITQEKMIMGGITGYMEAASSMGASNQILSVDYRHLIKLSDEEVRADYVPLTESDQTAYAYSEQMQYYPGNVADLTERNLTYNAVKQYGMGTHIIDFFFSAQTMPASYTERKVHSSRITVTPDKETAATNVSEARYNIARFNVDAKVYGYDETLDGSLYADSLTAQSLGGNAMRENIKIKTGKSFKDGDKVSLESVFAEKVSSTADYSTVSYAAYAVVDGAVDYKTKVNLPASFTYGAQYRNVAVAFDNKSDNGTRTKTTVFLTDYAEPTIKRVTDYDPDKAYTVGDIVKFPDVKYSWGGVDGGFIDNYFDNSEGLVGINIVRVAKFSIKSGVYAPTFFQCVITPETTTALSEKETVLLYELQNSYRERYYYEVLYSSESARRYLVTDDEGNVLTEGDVTYDKDGVRVPLNESFSFFDPDFYNTLNAIGKTYKLTVAGVERDLPLVSYTLYTNEVTQTEIPVDDVAAVMPLFEKHMRDDKYFYLGLNYSQGDDKITRKFLYNVTFGGKKEPSVMNYDAYFINKNYVAAANDLYSSDGVSLGSSYGYNLLAYRGDELMNNIVSQRYGRCIKDGYSVKTVFYIAGKFNISYGYRLTNLGGETVYFDLVQYFDVLSDKAQVAITYVTDEEHPFADGSTEKVVTYVLGDDMVTLRQGDNFLPTDARLFGWQTDVRQRPAAATLGGENFVGYESYNTTNVYLYALWDDGIQITTDINGVKTTYDDVYYRATETNKDTGDEKGSYCIDLSAFTPEPPEEGDASSYYFLGWTGGFIGTAVRNDKVYISGTEISDEYLTIRPVYKRYVRLNFTQPQNYVNGKYVFASASVLEGEKISNPGYYLRVKGSDGYTFKGWGVIVDGKANIIDLTKPIEATFADKDSYTLTLVAIFTDEEGNEVW